MLPNKYPSTVKLFFDPHELVLERSVFSLLRIIKLDNNLHFERMPIMQDFVSEYFHDSAADLKNSLIEFEKDSIKFLLSELEKKRLKGKSGINPQIFAYRGFVRHFEALIRVLVPSLNTEIVYHKTPIEGTKNFKTERCTFIESAPQLKFDIVKEGEKLSIIPFFESESTIEYLPNLERNGCFLRKDRVYWILTSRDTFTLDWLENANPKQYASNAALFLERIVKKIEETNIVQRHDYFDGNIINTKPSFGVLLSEVSGSMLMFSPRFIYDGIILEGDWVEKQSVTRQNQVYTIFRNQENEQYFIDFLQKLHPQFAKQSPKFFYLTFSEAKKKQWFLKAYHQLLEEDISVLGMEMLRYFRYSQHPPETKYQIIATKGNNTTILLGLKFGKEQISLRNLKRILLAGQNTFLLKDDTIAVLPDEWLAQYGTLLRHGQLDEHDHLIVSNWIFLYDSQNANIEKVISPQWKQKWLHWQNSDQVIIPPPNNIKATLRPYQQKGYEWLMLLSEIGAGACLSDDMGLGKTLQSITFLQAQLAKDAKGKSLIVCPASLVYNWFQELERFAPELKAFIYTGSNRNFDAFFEGEFQIMICTYGVIRSDINQLGLIQWQTVLLDESHNIKNANSQATQAVRQLMATNRVALSGTPIMNNTFELFPQIDFLLPGMFPNADFFKKQYANPIDKDGNKDKLLELNKLTAPFILRRTKEQVAKDLPEKTVTVLWCEMDAVQQDIYNQVLHEIRDNVYLDIEKDGFGKSKLGILQGILKLRQVCGAPSIMNDVAYNYCEDSIKVQTLMDEIERSGGKKSLVFSQFIGMLDLIAAKCDEQGISYLRFDGSTPIQQRAEMVNEFQSVTSNAQLFLISLKSGNAGLTLTAAEYVYLIDPWWNAAVEQQAIDRTHRIGQTKNVFAYKMICKNTIEEKIFKLQQRKKELADELIGEDSFVKNLSEEDINYLFS